jgi:hypothetical protein
MFDKYDAKKIADSYEMIPDGVYDASQYGEIISKVFSYLEGVNFNQEGCGIQFMMDCINECYDISDNESQFNPSKSNDVIISLCYFVINSLSHFDDETLNEFMKVHREEVIPNAIEDSKALPFYDFKNDAQYISDILDEISRGEFNEYNTDSKEGDDGIK